MSKRNPNYEDAVTYWSTQPTTVDGMLGGYGTGRVPRLDIQHSTLFLRQLISSGLVPAVSKDAPGEAGAEAGSCEGVTKTDGCRSVEAATRERVREGEGDGEGERGDGEMGKGVVRAADCGAGIGRVSRDLLLAFSSSIDIIEPCPPFTSHILSSPDLSASLSAGTLTVRTIGVQEFEPKVGWYHLIWNQWCLGHLSDAALVAYLGRAKRGLVSGCGVVVVKENVAVGEDVFDEADSSVTRTEESWNRVFRESGLVVMRSSVQHGFPKELFKVKIWALR